jgi:hypothetical protein
MALVLLPLALVPSMAMTTGPSVGAGARSRSGFGATVLLALVLADGVIVTRV